MTEAIHKGLRLVEILGLELSEFGDGNLEEKGAERSICGAQNLLSREAVEAEQLGDSCLLCQGDRTFPGSSSAIEECLRIPISWSCRCALGGPMSKLDKHMGHRKHFRPKEIEQPISEAGYTSEYDGRAGFPLFNLLPICGHSSWEAADMR